LPDLPPLYNSMTVDEYLGFVCEIKKVPRNERKKQINDIKQMVKIVEMGRRVLGNLSKGYRQRVGLAQALVGYPEALIFDEPTNGFDPKQIIEMRQVIKNLGKKHTLIISSHILSEVSAMCDRILIIHQGKIVASDTTTRLSTSLNQGAKMKVRLKSDKQRVISAFSDVALFKNVEPIGERERGTFDVEITGEKDTDIREAIFNCAQRNNIPILMLTSAELTLEEIFLQVTAGDGNFVDNVEESEIKQIESVETTEVEEDEEEGGDIDVSDN
ncbi:MAG: ABC transporter ATP-binding protein, partial [Defluviitaleaceae bacterium]|nr:ABC transporter ATP-binding protein [Defluviitaleaceae bacterium]